MRIAQATVGALLAAWLLIACADTQTRDDDQVPEERAPAGADDGTPSRPEPAVVAASGISLLRAVAQRDE